MFYDDCIEDKSADLLQILSPHSSVAVQRDML